MVSWTVILYILSRESLSYPVKNGGIHWEAKLVDCESLIMLPKLNDEVSLSNDGGVR